MEAAAQRQLISSISLHQIKEIKFLFFWFRSWMKWKQLQSIKFILFHLIAFRFVAAANEPDCFHSLIPLHFINSFQQFLFMAAAGPHSLNKHISFHLIDSTPSIKLKKKLSLLVRSPCLCFIKKINLFIFRKGAASGRSLLDFVSFQSHSTTSTRSTYFYNIFLINPINFSSRNQWNQLKIKINLFVFLFGLMEWLNWKKLKSCLLHKNQRFLIAE